MRGEGEQLYEDYKPFYELMEKGEIKAGTTLKVIRDKPYDDFYMITQKDKLVHIASGDGETIEGMLEPEDILSKEKAPHGWNIDRIN